MKGRFFDLLSHPARVLLFKFSALRGLVLPESFFTKLFRLFTPRLSEAILLRRFEMERNRLQQTFLQKAREANIPRGLRWTQCEWLPSMILLKDRQTNEICLLAGVNISFEAIEGGDMENVAAVSMLRDACAVFQLTPSGWQTSGRALFNMNPAEAAERLRDSYAPYAEAKP